MTRWPKDGRSMIEELGGYVLERLTEGRDIPDVGDGLERYCVDSGRPVRMIPGDRCLSHGDRAVMCYTALREARCQHPHLSPNHPIPHCSECGRDL